MFIYTGRGTLQDNNNTSHAESVVKTLFTDYLGKGHTVYLDNFYTSVPLAEALFKEKTGCVGTLRENRRENLKDVVKKKNKKGEVVWKKKGPVLVTNWRDKRNVRMISTKHKHKMIEIQVKKGIKEK
ncbi:hypothetical protein NQ314_002298 [Rhamnusium bicolor]|uniref:PiggyBac transposable element-derived protein domain-containing protein n=1 Tax=Rhamnusium bicolor TaxID=1586634 RepID=A0AAV8ZQ04_9CUCU|nr:hypothetical protein NQ314_002298 [Rhamnusium bicolor]